MMSVLLFPSPIGRFRHSLSPRELILQLRWGPLSLVALLMRPCLSYLLDVTDTTYARE